MAELIHTDQIAKVMYFGFGKLAFAAFDLQVCMLQLFEHFFQVFQMFFLCPGENNNIVQVTESKIMTRC